MYLYKRVWSAQAQPLRYLSINTLVSIDINDVSVSVTFIVFYFLYYTKYKESIVIVNTWLWVFNWSILFKITRGIWAQKEVKKALK